MRTGLYAADGGGGIGRVAGVAREAGEAEREGVCGGDGGEGERTLGGDEEGGPGAGVG